MEQHKCVACHPSPAFVAWGRIDRGEWFIIASANSYEGAMSASFDYVPSAGRSLDVQILGGGARPIGRISKEARRHKE